MTNFSRKHIQVIAMTLCIFAFVGIVLMSTATTAFCADDLNSFEAAVNKLTEKGYDILRNIIVPVCIVMLGYAGFQFLVGGNQGSEKARKIVISVVLAICFVVFAPMLVNEVASQVKDSGNGDWGSYNPLKDKK